MYNPHNHIYLAAKILRVDYCASRNEIKYAYYRLISQHHPDKNKGDPRAGQRTALINEARDILMGHNLNPTLLKDNGLVSEVLECPLREDETVLSYEEWLKSQFFNVQEASIWA